MCGLATYVGLPEEFAPPDAAAARIAALDTLAEREALFARIPAGGWRDWIAHEARIAIALRIVDEPSTLELRRLAIERAPEAWRAQVRAYVKSFWKTRGLRVAHRAKLAAQRRAEHDSRRAA